ncbi:MAG: glutathione S-transferase [Gammaproteobacteria bacterium]|nr:glutathione S-transferase [Gammaproteobacteria bacterium]|tara:strand:+ start:3223 stop:3936 length:714 start_codon:yes stop_codon:yes gene_type:complete
MINLYSWSTPNGQKASIMLEELQLDYCVSAVNIGKGEQHDPAFRRISPNGKIPAITDAGLKDATGAPVRIFESGNILIYLAEKSGQLLPAQWQDRTEVLAWVFFQVGHLGPMVGQWHWFDDAAPAKSELAITRYKEETLHLLEVLNGRLGVAPYLGGTDYSIADIANYAWAKSAVDQMQDEEPDATAALESLRDWLQRVGARPAVQRGMKVPSEAQKEASATAATIEGPAAGGTALP